MTISRRSFSFASLAALFGAHAAQAATPVDPTPTIPEVDDPQAPAADPVVKVVPSLRKEGGALVLTLAVHNGGADPLEVLAAYGSRPAVEPEVTVRVAGVEQPLVRILGPVDRREMMSRMGPMPTWASVAPGETIDLGPIRFELPRGAEPPVTVRGAIDGMGRAHPFEAKGLTWASKSS